jgi:hypothetical protein
VLNVQAKVLLKVFLCAWNFTLINDTVLVDVTRVHGLNNLSEACFWNFAVNLLILDLFLGGELLATGLHHKLVTTSCFLRTVNIVVPVIVTFLPHVDNFPSHSVLPVQHPQIGEGNRDTVQFVLVNPFILILVAVDSDVQSVLIAVKGVSVG